MSYPDYPDNRLIVDGVDLTEKFKMVLLDGYELNPPEPKLYTIDIPGGNGVIDLTESLSGDVLYNNREQNFEFDIIGVTDFEKIKTEIMNFIHGKAYDYTMTMDEGYTYHGRFKVTELSHKAYSNGIVATVKLNISANPYKMKETQERIIQARGGTVVQIESGRLRVNPTISTFRACTVIVNGIKQEVGGPVESMLLENIVLKYGLNDVYIRSGDISGVTYGYFKENDLTFADVSSKKIYEWYNQREGGGDPLETYVVLRYKWGDL